MDTISIDPRAQRKSPRICGLASHTPIGSRHRNPALFRLIKLPAYWIYWCRIYIVESSRSYTLDFRSGRAKRRLSDRPVLALSFQRIESSYLAFTPNAQKQPNRPTIWIAHLFFGAFLLRHFLFRRSSHLSFIHLKLKFSAHKSSSIPAGWQRKASLGRLI